MNSAINTIKSLCDEYLNALNIDELNLKCLNKIINILKTNEKYQKDVFIHLSEKGLSKLMAGMKENNQDIRKHSIKLLIEILHNNEVLQNIFCEKFGFNPIGNIICMNWMPKHIKDNIQINESVINDIKNSYYPNRCKFWMWPYDIQNTKYNEHNYPDPMKYLVGFYYANKNNNLNNVLVEDKYKLNLNNLTSQLENNAAFGEIAAGSGSESATKIEQTSLKKNNASYDYDNGDKPINTEPAQKGVGSKGISNRNKSPFINQNSIAKASEVSRDAKSNLSPEKIERMQQLKNMINNPNTKLKTSILTSQVGTTGVNNIIDKLKIVDRKDSISSKLEEYKKSIKTKGYSKSIDTNNPLNTLSNVPASKPGDSKKAINKTPIGKYPGYR